MVSIFKEDVKTSKIVMLSIRLPMMFKSQVVRLDKLWFLFKIKRLEIQPRTQKFIHGELAYEIMKE